MISMLASDSDPNGDALSVSSGGTPNSGTAVIRDTSIVYTPGSCFDGRDSFSHTVRDGSLAATATVTVSVTATRIFTYLPIV